MLQNLISLYGEEKGKDLDDKIKELIDKEKKDIVCKDGPLWDERDVFLITYPDSFIKKNLASLASLESFLELHLRGVINGVHVLPFFPFTTDRGFSVSDFGKVKPEFGSWEDVKKIANEYRLMVDLVLNHVSVQHEWFQKFLQGDPRYQDYFIWFKKDEIPHQQLNKVFRPRATPVLTPFKTAEGERFVWTTFSVEGSTDQVDLNYKNPEVFLEIIKIILNLLKNGVRVFRLDSIPYIWKELGTDCINLPQTHTIVQVLRNVLDMICPDALIITQVATSFEDNISYFGKSDKEAQMIYNFSLPPVVLNAFFTQNNRHINDLAAKMVPESEDNTFLNILAVHDGISIRGGFLSEEETQNLCDDVVRRGGEVSYRLLPDGTKRVRELNTTWWSVLNKKDELPEIALRKFITSHAIMLSLRGIPAIYYLSFFGAKDDLELYKKTGIKRDINRTNLDLETLDFRLSKSDTRETHVFQSMIDLIKKRKDSSAFHPNARQQVLNVDDRVFALLRINEETGDTMLCLHNVSGEIVSIDYEGNNYDLERYNYVWAEI